MQSELKKGEIIVEVVCAGPKNYAYKTYNSATGESNIVCSYSSSKWSGLGSIGVGVAVEVWCRGDVGGQAPSSLTLTLGWGSVCWSRAMGGVARPLGWASLLRI